MKTMFITVGVLLVLLIGCKNGPNTPQSASTGDKTTSTTANPSGSGLVGRKLYVHPANGVVLRDKPGKEGNKIASLARNGSPLTVISAPDPANRFVAEAINGFQIADDWVQVRTEDGKEGFLFAGYLSKYCPALEESEEGVMREEAFYQTISPFQGEKETIAPAEPHIGGYRRRYADGAVFELINFSGGVDCSLTIPASVMTQQEALVIFRSLYFDKAETKAEYDATSKRLTISGNEGYETLTIEPRGDKLFVKLMSAD